MNRDVLWVAAFMVILGTVLFVLGAILVFGATLNTDEASSSTTDAVRFYNDIMKGSLLETIGTVVALVGIAMGFIGMALKEPVRICQTCGSTLFWIHEKQGHYCFQCKEFV